MSKFQTRIPVPVKPLLDVLPSNAFVHSYVYDEQKHELTVTWESDAHHTGYTFPVDVTVEEMASKNPLKRFKSKSATPTKPKAKNPAMSLPEPEKAIPVSVPDNNWDKERFDAEKAAGAVIEFQGVEPVWKPLAMDDQWQEGFLYRKKVVDNPIPSA